MSLERSAIPSSRMREPSLIMAKDAVHDLIGSEVARRYALAPALFSNDGQRFLIGHRRPTAIIIVAAASLAAEMAALANEIDNANIAFLGIASGCERLAIGPDNI